MTPRKQFAIICSIVAAFFAAEVSGECLNADVCVPGPVNAARLVDNMVTATSTCGDPRRPPAKYCRVKPLNQCFRCTQSDNHTKSDFPLKTHTLGMMTDDSVETSWQSVTWWEWYNDNNKTDEPLKVNVTMSFNKSYAITGEIRLVFKSPRPIAMIIEKSDDKGQTWIPLQYYAEDCTRRFNMSSTLLDNIVFGDYGIHCVEDYSELDPQEDGQLLFDSLRRYSKSDFWNATLQKYFTATDIRLQMLHPNTQGQDNLNIKTEAIFNQYYYSIADFKVVARCQCHGHAKYCDYPNLHGKDCDCSHNTEGEDCERCMPLYNNKTWMPASSDNEPNPCEECQCYSHSDSCHYNESLGHGVCDNCYHQTTGLFCEQCVQKFYRNMSKTLYDPEVCLPCKCFMFGITNNGTCNQTTGQCECKQNVTGRQCDRCADTFWDFHSPPIGDCQECSCNSNGTKNGSISCQQDSGQCLCKDNVDQRTRTCSQCKDGFFSFPTTVDKDCLQCDCDYGGSIKEICEKNNGTCLCRSHIIGKRCTEVSTGYFVASFTYLKYEAEDAKGSYVPTSYFITGVNQQFTGRGYARIGINQFISFTVTPDTNFSDFYIAIRYTSIEANITLRLSISSCNSSDCHEINSFTIEQLSRGAGLAWLSPDAVSFSRGLVYFLNLTFVSGVYFNSTIEIDSLILLPKVSDLRIHEVAQNASSVHGMTFRQIEDCWNNSTTITGLQNSSEICSNVTFSVMAEVFDGAIACSCNSTGTKNGTTCEQLGGQCHCKPGVTGQSCDRCLPGYFNFSDSGCTACNCSKLGSSDLVCDPATGQCPCRPGIITRNCSRCNANYYGFHTGQGCIECKCNASGSANLQCNENGVCLCKNSTNGTKCDKCRQNFFNFTSEGCKPCNCDKGGSSLLQCNLNTGTCTCKANAEGNKCERCKNGTYNSDPLNPDGCSPCFCFGRSNECSSARGFVKSYIPANFAPASRDYAELSGISMSDLAQGFVINFTAGSFMKLSFSESFKGNQLRSYSQLIKMTINHTNESLNSTWNVTLRGTNQQQTSFNIVPPPSLSNVEYHAQLHEKYTLNSLTAFELQSILIDIESLQIFASFEASGIVSVSVKLVSATEGVGEEVDYVENCTCPNNYTQLSCGFCNSGFTRQTPRLDNTPHPLSSCVLCSCTHRSRDCHPENGTCYNCRMGSEGEYCERCQPGVDNTTDCKHCSPGFFGLTPSSGGCQDCDCVLPNTMYSNSSVCNETTGQCTCKPRIGGRQCDRCHENAYNTSRGCVDCPECYRLIFVEVNELRATSDALGNTIERLRNGIIGDASFAHRLSNAEKSISGLVSDAEESRDIEKNLTKEIMQLNETLNQMEYVLEQEVKPGVEKLSDELDSVTEDKTTTEILIQQIRDTVHHSNSVLNMSIDPSVRDAEEIAHDLSNLVTRFSALASNFTAAATRQNDTANEIKSKVDSAETLANQAQIKALNAVSDQNDLKFFLNNLEKRQDIIRALGEQLNSTGYQLYVDALSVLSRANQTLSEAVQLDPNNTNTVSQIEAATAEASNRSREVVLLAQNLTQIHSNLTLQVGLAVEEAKALMSRVSNAEETGQSILDEARRAKKEALDAVQLASKTFSDAQEMLQILLNFEAKSQEAREFAELSLQRAKAANVTSFKAIEFAQSINASLQNTLRVARHSLNLAQQAWNISYDNNQGVLKIHADANRLSQDGAKSKYTTGYFSVLEQNVTSINNFSKGPITLCTQNYSKFANDSLHIAYKAKGKADEADAAAKNLKMNVDRVKKEVSSLQQVNITRLLELRNEIQRIRAEFNQTDVADIISELRVAKEKQQEFVKEYQEKVRKRKQEISELKQLYASLSSVTCEKPSRTGAVLES